MKWENVELKYMELNSIFLELNSRLVANKKLCCYVFFVIAIFIGHFKCGSRSIIIQ